MEDLYCFLGAALSLFALLVMVLLIRSMPRARIFRGWRDVFAAWREIRGRLEVILFLALLFRYLCGGGTVAVVLMVVSAALTIGTSLCGLNPDALKVVREIVNDVLDVVRNLKN